ncbi:MAG: hypothetical protein CME69_03980 [Halobacteriovorax sp.]|nr:hypothetical protein [Halobacteriovorax sp.]
MREIKNFYLLILKMIIFIVAVLTLIIGMKFYFSHLLTPSEYGLGVLEDEDEKIDLLIIGSSHTRQSYDVKIIEKNCQCNAKVIAYNGLDPYFMAPMIEWIKDNFKIRKWIVEAYNFKTIAPPKLSDSRIFTHSPVGLKWSFLKKLKSINTSYTDLFKLITTENNESIIFSPIENILVNRYSYKGGYTRKKTSHISQEDFNQSFKNVDYFKGMKTNLNQVNSILKIKELLTDSDVLYIDPPMPAPVMSHEITKQLINDYKKLIPNYKAPWLNTPMAKNNKNFVDWNHLSTLGRENYSNLISTKLHSKHKIQ